jgi:hypothetical protein
MVGARRAGIVMRELTEDRPYRHVVAAVRKGAEEAPAVGRVLGVLRETADTSPRSPVRA